MKYKVVPSAAIEISCTSIRAMHGVQSSSDQVISIFWRQSL